MDVTQLLAHLDGVRGRNGAYTARCPAHEDRTPSLAIRDEGDGLILLHCFGGCATEDILGVLGLTFADICPGPIAHHRPSRKAFSAVDVLRCMRTECSVVLISAADMAEGKPVDVDRISTACGRLSEALEYAHGS